MNVSHKENSRGGFWVLLLGLPIFVFASGKNISFVLYAISLLLAITSVAKHSAILRKVSGVFLCLSVAAIFSFFDIDLRRGQDLSLRWMPTVYNLGSNELVRKEEAKGHKVDEDFIVKTIPPFANYVRVSLVLTIP